MQSLLTKIVYAITRAILDAWRDWSMEPHNARFIEAGEADMRLRGDLYARLRAELDRVSEPTHENLPLGKTDKG